MKIFITLFFLCFQIIVTAQTADSIYIWQGFKHSWTYNHRINRIGNFLDEKNKEIVYTAASGLGADSTYYESKYTLITDSDIHAYRGNTSIQLLGKESEAIIISKEIKVAIAEEDQGKKFYPLLNGFDMLSIKKADKLEVFDVKISAVEQGVISDFITIRIDVILQADCSTLECSYFKQKVDYNLDVHYVILFGKRESFSATNYKVSHAYKWDKEEEIYLYKDRHEVGISQNFQQTAIGIQQFSISFDTEHWIMKWNNYITDVEYDIDNNMLGFNIELSYKEWAANMKKESAFPRHSRFSKRGEGSVELKTGLLLISFENGKKASIVKKGAMFWRGKNQSADSEDAVDRQKIDIKK
jgi:hypothetical protein